MATSAATQEKFTNLRKRLDQLGYRQPLGIETLPLVERLFADLVHTTDSLKKTKLDLAKTPADKETIDAHVEAYKSDNGKLVKETNELHQQLIKLKEDSESQLKDMKSSLRKIEHENADLRFLNNQYVHKIRALETESKQKSDKILELQEKNFHAVVQTPNGRKKNIPFRRQRMEIDSAVPPSSARGRGEGGAAEGATVTPSTSGTSGYNTDEPFVADLLQVADTNIGRLRDQCQQLGEEKDALQRIIDSLRLQVTARDGEVDRLTHLLEGGRPYDVVALEAKNRSNERLIAHLNIQIDYLQQKNCDMQKQLDETWEKARSASLHKTSLGTRNIELETELETVDRMAQRLQEDRDATVRAAGKEIEDTKVELDKARAEIARLDAMLNNTTADKDELTVQHSEMENVVDKVQQDKKKLATRITKLIATEKQLVLELDRAKYGKNGVRKSKNTAAVEELLKKLEEDRDYWKQEAELSQKLLRTKRSPSPKSPTRSRSPSKNMQRSRSPSPVRVKEAKLAAAVKRLEDELAHTQHENEILRSLNNRSSTLGMLSKRETDSLDVASLIQERDELRGMINKFERHMAEIQANVKVLTQERDKLDCMYQRTKEELTYLRKEIVKTPQKPKTSVAAQSVLRRVENERDDAIAELRKAAAERDTLRERLKIATNSHLNDRANLEQRIEDLERMLNDAESLETAGITHRNRLKQNVQELEDLVSQRDKQLGELQDQLDSILTELGKTRGTVTNLNSLLEESDKSLKTTHDRLTRRETELSSGHKKIRDIEELVTNLQNQGGKDMMEISRLKSTINTLDKAKDELQVAVDEKTLSVTKLEEDLRHRDRQVVDLRQTVTELDQAIQRLKDVCSEKDREIVSLQRQLDETRVEIDDTLRAREVALRENRRLQDDLATMTRENQNLNQDVAESYQEKEDLKARIQDYLVQIKSLSDQLAAKEKERTDLLTQYRSLSTEAEQYQSQTHHLESETSTLRLEMMTKDSEIRRLREQVDNLDVENRQHQKTLRSYETQISDQTKNVAALEADVRLAEQQKYGVQQDLFAVRDLCTRLERTKDELQRQLSLKSLDFEKLQALTEDMRAETENLRSQVGHERDNVYSLEGLIKSNREKEYETSMALQERDAEIQLLKDRIALNDSKADSMNREIAMSRNRSIEQEGEIDRLKRTLTNERFEKERFAQELRRSGLSVPGETRLSRSADRNASPVVRPSSRSPFRYTNPS